MGHVQPKSAKHLCCEAGACIHDKRPQLLTASNAANVQAIIIALLYMLSDSGVGDIVVVALLHGSVGIVDCDPLQYRTKPSLHMPLSCV